MTPKLSGHISIFDLGFFVLKSLEKVTILLLKPGSYVMSDECTNKNKQSAILSYQKEQYQFVSQSITNIWSAKQCLHSCVFRHFAVLCKTTGITSKEKVKADWLIFLFACKRIHTMNIPFASIKQKKKKKKEQKKIKNIVKQLKERARFYNTVFFFLKWRFTWLCQV